jgi:predicted amidohydrolase
MTWLRLAGPEVKSLQSKAKEKAVYVAVGLAEIDDEGKKWNTHIVISPTGEIAGKHNKIYLTKEKGFTEAGTQYNVFEVKGIKMGISICADGTDRRNLQALADKRAQIIYGPHANTTGGTIAGWYKFRAGWAGPDGWIAQLKVYAALHNHAAHFAPEYNPPSVKAPAGNWASGAWFIGPDGKTIAQMPSSTQKSDSKEYVLTYNIPIPSKSGQD